jgi:uncharacterized protein YkwD
VAGCLVLVCAGGGFWALTNWSDSSPEEIATREENDSSASADVHERKPVEATPPAPDPTRQTAVKPVEKEPAVEAKPPASKPPREKPAVTVKPPDPPPPLAPRPTVREEKETALTEDLPPELEFQLVDAINAQREQAGVERIFLDREASGACRAHARYLARNAARLTGEESELHEEDAARPGFSDLGRRHARAATIAAEKPPAAIEKWLADPVRRKPLLEPRLRTFGAGFAANVNGRWFSVFDWTTGLEREPPLETTPVSGAIAFPAPGQTRVPLWFPGNEVPDPLPEATNKLAGYPITVMFAPRTRVEGVVAHLTEKGEVELWLSSPEKPANPMFAALQQGTICLIAKRPLKPNMRYQVEVTAQVNDEPWSAKWAFTTMTEGEIHHEMAGRLLRTLNEQRRRAGLRPVHLDPESSRTCAAHACYLGINAANDAALNWNEEKQELAGYTPEGAALARTASIQGGGGPTEAVTGLVDSLTSRPQLLDPHVVALGLGYTPSPRGGWIWVMDFQRRPGTDPVVRELLYPAPDQKDVPLAYPSEEVPSPIPAEGRGRGAGYAITAEFPFGTKIVDATAKLVDAHGEALEGWLSTPAEPAIPGYRQRAIGFLPKAPLKPGMRYTTTFAAEVNGRRWQRSWSFTTLQEPDRFSDDLDQRLLARVNALRKAAGLSAVRLDESLSHGCQLHARYLAINAKHPSGKGMAVHQEDDTLPGATPEGARAAKGSVIAVVLDPVTCVDGWLATLYHRIPILAPNLERIGFGHARVGARKWACVLDTINGRTAPKQPGTRPTKERNP